MPSDSVASVQSKEDLDTWQIPWIAKWDCRSRAGSQAVLRLNNLSYLAIGSKSNTQVVCRCQPVIISPGEKCFTPPFCGNLFTNFTMCITIRTTIMVGTLSKGKLWRRDQILSFKNRMFWSIKPQCCDAAAQSKLGFVGRPTAKSPMESNSWSPLITTIWKP